MRFSLEALPETFAVRFPGKWVGAGEHAVLRGQPAIVFQHSEFNLDLSLAAQPGFTDVTLAARAAYQSAGIACEIGHRRIWIRSTIPSGAGLGSSAAFCAALSSLVSAGGDPDLARRLENCFHGESSGMDIAAVFANGPLQFERGRSPAARPLRVAGELPKFSFHDTGLRAATRDCIAQVVAAARPDLDAQMGKAAALLVEAIESPAVDPSRRLALWRESFEVSHACYERWGLIPKGADAMRHKLIGEGALSARLTGAGCGGFWVAIYA